MNVDMDSIVIDIQSTSENATKAIDDLVKKLGELQTALSNVGKSSNDLKKLKDNIPNISGKPSTPASSNKSNIKDKIESMKPDLKGFKVASVLSSENTKGITTEIIKYKNKLGDTITVQKKMRDGMVDYYRVTKKTTTDGVSGFKKLKDSVLGVGAKLTTMIVGAKNLAKNFSELVETSAEYTEAVNLFYTEMGDKAQEAEGFVKKFSDALYLDPADVMRYMGSFNSLVSGLGVGADNSYKMSKNLTQLTYDLASYKNIDIESAFDKLQSGVAGQIKGLRQVGVALSQNSLQELANEMGIKRRINTLDEASKAQLRYIQIMRSSTNWQGDLGKTMMSTENILRSARQQWTLFVRALGDVGAVIARAVLPYFIALTQIVKEAAVALAKFFGLDIDFSDRFKEGGKSASIGLGKIEDGIGGVGSAAKKAKKDINSMLAPFDDLNVVQTKVENAGSGAGGSAGGGYSLGDLPLPEYDALSKLTGEWSGKIEEAKKKLKEMIPIALTVAGALASIWATNKIANFISSIGTIRTAFKSLKSGITKIAGFFGLSFGELALIIAAIAINIVVFIKAIKPLNKIFDNTKKSSDGLIGSFNKLNLKEKAIVIASLLMPISRVFVVIKTIKEVIDRLKAGESLGDIFQSWFPGISAFAINAYNAIKGFVEKSFNKISSVFGTIGKWFGENVVEPIKNTIDSIGSTFGLIWTGIIETFGTISDWFNEHVIQPIINVFSPIVDWFAKLFNEIWKTISDIFNNIIGIFKGCWEIIKLVWGVVSDWFNEHVIQPVGKFFVNMWNTIKTTAINLWEGIKSIFNTVATWVNNTIIQPVVKIVSTLWNGLKDGAKKAWDGIKSVFSTVATFFKNTFQKAWEGVKKVFSIGGKIFDGIKDGIVKAFTTIVNAIIKGINKVVSIPFNGINKALEKIKNISILGKEPFKDKISTIHVPQIPLLSFESGGYPERASLFWANENGIPEMVGRIGNQTAVANNDQITTSITNALITALSGMNFGGQGTTVVNIGNKKVYEGMGEYLDGESERYGTAYVNI